MLLVDMRSLACGNISCILFEEIFLRQMPDDVWMQLAHADFTNLQKFDDRADEICQARPTDANIQSVKRSKTFEAEHTNANKPVHTTKLEVILLMKSTLYNQSLTTRNLRCST
ncbi:hypothetical protein RF11_10901 [Thelohanellus kitauei]|uniref:Uncharacterized protein n=1 Tax=Thelohanellus kitauei TaxID=669202 RepID=A0A0C2I8N1_THEKT|nr:hypothetical protein RF11_10901 [Thelohanellus kitauei]